MSDLLRCKLIGETFSIICMVGHRKGGAMIFRQLFDQVSGTYSYQLANRPRGEVLIIDPVLP